MWNSSVVAAAFIFFCIDAVAAGVGCGVDLSKYDGPYFYSNVSYKKTPLAPYNSVGASDIGRLDAYYLVYRDSGRIVYLEKRLHGKFQWYKHYLYRGGFLVIESNVLGKCSVVEVRLQELGG